jgi:signal transduction histidine kinase
MHAEMLRDGVVPTEAKRDEYYARMTAEAERLSRLINNVLEFSQLEQNTRQLVLVTGPLAPVVAEAARLLGPHAEREGFELRVEMAPDLPPVRFERDALLQVLFNLVDNALKYAREAPRRRVTLLGRQDGATVRLAVRDDGPGVAPSHLGRIFEPFYRGESELTRRSKGTGIGLALVRGLVERMGAAVSGRNVAEGGFEVEIVFPRASVPPATICT